MGPEEAATETSDAFPEEVVAEEIVSESEAIILEPTEESVENTVDFAKIADEMDVNVLEEEGKRFLQKEDWSTALKYFDQLVQLDGERVDNWVNRGRALEMLGREGEAIESYDYAIQANPDLPSPFLYKAALLSRLERFEEAQQFYNAALSKVPVQKSKPAKVAG
ncbi:MAG: tetratricopeptide repeat protein [Cyanothece sp. SIO1E1]|nr:tetratricopeptide repeat protein [Cyanothece sp. SIO1E1]